ncbi:response regulator transcription factor [Sulfurimonas indica]|uniref:response regulator transcription factor n=1 Tax=Sulfurimonas indica TaxID=2508707 RepID=UPI00126467D2|nr:LuxR C-terminal-related transcriptional regulator [Sulfurimonas indica]
MNIILFSQDENFITEWQEKLHNKKISSAYDYDSLVNITQNNLNTYIILSDFDTVASEINTVIASAKLPKYLAIVEKVPEIATGKMLISHGIKAYGNSRMLKIHANAMIEAVQNNKIWTYPELTAALAARGGRIAISDDARAMIEHRLTQKESEVIYLILNGLTNSAIAQKLNISLRTVKAHISAIFTKLHVNDRISLVLLLK